MKFNFNHIVDKLFGIKERIPNEVGFDYAFRAVCCPVAVTGFFSYIKYIKKRKKYLQVWKNVNEEEQLKWIGFHWHDINHAEADKQAAIEHEIIMDNLRIALNNWNPTGVK